jgi:hypothetical protein
LSTAFSATVSVFLYCRTMQFVGTGERRVWIDVRACFLFWGSAFCGPYFITLLRDVTLCNPIEVYRRFGRRYSLFICDGFFLCSLPDAEDTVITIIRNVW